MNWHYDILNPEGIRVDTVDANNEKEALRVFRNRLDPETTLNTEDPIHWLSDNGWIATPWPRSTHSREEL